ncbi:EAL domain-containing protein [Colwellia sp. 1_MG-2023]|uniref:bifunctional diguanylate cyclase/phosphodiesterase n=1 Tax=Colwellia sp. 1_MG-2023 TaxID=3062649 RepID=UPI0026E45002|nr:EAL domain-containing protein [Colwellia sp. 1_MG-2023]MDO6445432.1 EAL domain-containing protein [Colwellia sp. 1_MG-2023]
MEVIKANKLLIAQQEVIGKIALADSLKSSLNVLCQAIDAFWGSVAVASVMVKRENYLQVKSAPNLPVTYLESLNHVRIASDGGACGKAAFYGKTHVSKDIKNDPCWEQAQVDKALKHGFSSCWSIPIFASTKEVIGTFAIYFPSENTPTDNDFEFIGYFTHLAGIAIESDTRRSQELLLTQQLERANTQFLNITKVIPDVAILLSESGDYIELYGQKNLELHVHTDEIIGKNVCDLHSPATANKITNTIQRALCSNSVESLEYIISWNGVDRHFEGRVVKVPENVFTTERTVLWLARNITEKIKRKEQIESLAMQDSLTGIANRRCLNQRIQTAYQQAKTGQFSTAVLYVDLDNFKDINDMQGHGVGDCVLQKAVETLSSNLPPDIFLSRVGGDEFVVLIQEENYHTNTTALSYAEKILELLSKPISINNVAYFLGASIGYYLIDNSTKPEFDAISFSDIAMYEAKKRGGGQIVCFEPSMLAKKAERLELERAILNSLKFEHFYTLFQPLVDSNGNVLGAEALCRWEHPKLGYITPDTFIPIAEHLGVIFDLQDRVLADTCRLLKSVNRVLGDQNFKVSINISSILLKNQQLKSRILATLEKFNITPKQLKLEITETTLVEIRRTSLDQLKELQRLGMTISLDDFGTGYSSLSYIDTLPVDELKIDGSFIKSMMASNVKLSLVDTIINLGKLLGYKVVAECVETREELALLKEKSVDLFQGYYFSKALNKKDILNYITTNERNMVL